MKKILIILIVFASVGLSAQSLPNSDFESWDNIIIYEQPENWNTPNPYTSLLGAISVTKSDDAFSGSYSTRMETKDLLDGQIVVPGLITLADFAIDIFDSSFSISGGYFLQENIYKMTGRYKYEGVGGDQASVLIYNFKNTPENGFDTIGVGVQMLDNASEWTEFSVYMVNLKNIVPDTFNVLIASSSLTNANPGSTLFVDSLSIYTNTGIIDLWQPRTALKVYPNPSTDYVNFSTEQQFVNGVLTIYDNFGQVIIEKDYSGHIEKVDISKLSSGIYTYKLSDKNKIINSGSFLKN